MRRNIHDLLNDLDAAGVELDTAVDARVTGSFRKLFKQDDREFSALARYESIVKEITDTLGHCVTLQKSIRANRVDLAQKQDHLNPAYMAQEGRVLERVAELRRLTERPEPTAPAGDQPEVIESTTEA